MGDFTNHGFRHQQLKGGFKFPSTDEHGFSAIFSIKGGARIMHLNMFDFKKTAIYLKNKYSPYRNFSSPIKNPGADRDLII